VLFNVVCNLKAEVNKYALSYLWWIIEPALHLFILYIVFGIFFHGNSNPNFIPFLFCGIIPWFWFNKSIANGMDAILKGRHIIKDTYIPKYFFPTVSIMMDAVKELVVLFLLLIVLIITGLPPTKTWLFLPLVILLEFLLIASIVYLVSIIIPYFLDLKHVINTGLQILMFGAGTFYDFRTMPEVYHKFYLLNPISLLINMFRDVLMYNKPINFKDYLYILSYVCFFGVLSFIAHKKLDREVPKVLFR
jgi:lipopolysaccharide transport system permease protein